MRVDETGCFLQYKENKNLVLYPEVAVTEKKKKGDKASWHPDAQGWVVTQVQSLFRQTTVYMCLYDNKQSVVY